MWQNVLVVGVVVAFVVVLLYRVRPSFAVRASLPASKAVADAREKLRSAQTPREKAEALCLIGHAYAQVRAGRAAAMAQFIRALKVDPSWPAPVEHLKALLFKERPRVLERTMWRRLSLVEWRSANHEVAIACTSVLCELYKHRLRDRSRALVMHRLMQEIERCGKEQAAAAK